MISCCMNVMWSVLVLAHHFKSTQISSYVNTRSKSERKVFSSLKLVSSLIRNKRSIKIGGGFGAKIKYNGRYVEGVEFLAVSFKNLLMRLSSSKVWTKVARVIFLPFVLLFTFSLFYLHNIRRQEEKVS